MFYDESKRLMRLFSAGLKSPDLRKLRLRLRLFPPKRCPDPAFEYFSLPFAVTLIRLAAALFVFALGILNLFLYSDHPIFRYKNYAI